MHGVQKGSYDTFVEGYLQERSGDSTAASAAPAPAPAVETVHDVAPPPSPSLGVPIVDPTSMADLLVSSARAATAGDRALAGGDGARVSRQASLSSLSNNASVSSLTMGREEGKAGNEAKGLGGLDAYEVRIDRKEATPKRATFSFGSIPETLRDHVEFVPDRGQPLKRQGSAARVAARGIWRDHTQAKQRDRPKPQRRRPASAQSRLGYSGRTRSRRSAKNTQPTVKPGREAPTEPTSVPQGASTVLSSDQHGIDNSAVAAIADAAASALQTYETQSRSTPNLHSVSSRSDLQGGSAGDLRAGKPRRLRVPGAVPIGKSSRGSHQFDSGRAGTRSVASTGDGRRPFVRVGTGTTFATTQSGTPSGTVKEMSPMSPQMLVRADQIAQSGPAERGLVGVLSRISQTAGPVPLDEGERPSASVVVTHIPDEFSIEVDLGPVYEANRSVLHQITGVGSSKLKDGTWRKVEFPPRVPTVSARDDAKHLKQVIDKMMSALPGVKVGHDIRSYGPDGEVLSALDLAEALHRVKAEAKVCSIGLHELARQVAGQCYEQGQIMANLLFRLTKMFQGVPALFRNALDGQSRQIDSLSKQLIDSQHVSSQSCGERIVAALAEAEYSGDQAWAVNEGFDRWHQEFQAIGQHQSSAEHTYSLLKHCAECADEAVTEDLSAKNNKLQTRVEELESSLKHTQQVLSRITDERDDMEEDLAQLSEELGHMQALQTELQTTQRKLDDSNQQVKALNSQIQRLRRPSLVGSFTSKQEDTTPRTARSRSTEGSVETEDARTVASLDSHKYGAGHIGQGSPRDDSGRDGAASVSPRSQSPRKDLDDVLPVEAEELQQAMAKLIGGVSSHTFRVSDDGIVTKHTQSSEEDLLPPAHPQNEQSVRDGTNLHERIRELQKSERHQRHAREKAEAEVAKLKESLAQATGGSGTAGSASAWSSSGSSSRRSAMGLLGTIQEPGSPAVSPAPSAARAKLLRVSSSLTAGAAVRGVMDSIQATANAGNSFSTPSVQDSPMSQIKQVSTPSVTSVKQFHNMPSFEEQHTGGFFLRQGGAYQHGVVDGVDSGGARISADPDGPDARDPSASTFFTGSAFAKLVGWDHADHLKSVSERSATHGRARPKDGVPLNLKDDKLVSLRITLQNLLGAKSLADEAADVVGTPRLSLTEVCFKFLVEKFGSRAVAVSEGKQLVYLLSLYRTMDAFVDLFARFLEEAYSTAQLSFMLWIRQAIEDSPFGIEYSSPHPDWELEPDYVCLFRCGLLVRAVARLLGFEGPAASAQSARSGKHSPARGAISRATDDSASAVSYASVTGMAENLATLGSSSESAANIMIGKLMSVCELVPSVDDGDSDVGVPSPVRKIIAGKVLENAPPDAVEGSHRMKRVQFLRFMIEEYERQRVRRWQRLWGDWITAVLSSSGSTTVKGKAKVDPASATIDRKQLQTIMRSLDPEIHDGAINRLHAECASFSLRPEGITWAAFATVVARQQLLEDRFDELPRLADQYVLSRKQTVDVFDHLAEALTKLLKCARPLIAAEPNPLIRTWIHELSQHARATIDSKQYISAATDAVVRVGNGLWRLASTRACGKTGPSHLLKPAAATAALASSTALPKLAELIQDVTSLCV